MGGEAFFLGALVAILVRAACWTLRERSRRKTLVDLERERRITLIALAELEPGEANGLRARLEKVHPPTGADRAADHVLRLNVGPLVRSFPRGTDRTPSVVRCSLPAGSTGSR